MRGIVWYIPPGYMLVYTPWVYTHPTHPGYTYHRPWYRCTSAGCGTPPTDEALGSI